MAAELLVFLGDGRDEVQKLRGDDLVGVNVVAHDVNGAGENRFRHAMNVPCAVETFNQISTARKASRPFIDEGEYDDKFPSRNQKLSI